LLERLGHTNAVMAAPIVMPSTCLRAQAPAHRATRRSGWLPAGPWQPSRPQGNAALTVPSRANGGHHVAGWTLASASFPGLPLGASSGTRGPPWRSVARLGQVGGGARSPSAGARTRPALFEDCPALTAWRCLSARPSPYPPQPQTYPLRLRRVLAPCSGLLSVALTLRAISSSPFGSRWALTAMERSARFLGELPSGESSNVTGAASTGGRLGGGASMKPSGSR